MPTTERALRGYERSSHFGECGAHVMQTFCCWRERFYVVKGANGFLKQVEFNSVRGGDGVDKDHGEWSKRWIQQNPVVFCQLTIPFSSMWKLRSPVHVFSLLWNRAVSELSKATEVVLESKACSFIASRTDLSGAACRRLSPVDDRQY